MEHSVFSGVTSLNDANVDREPASKPAMLKLLTVVALIATLYVIETRAGWEIIKNPPGYGSESKLSFKMRYNYPIKFDWL